MSSLRNKKSSSGRHHSESDAHVIKKQPNEAKDQQSSSVHSSPRYRHRLNNGELDSHSRRSPSSKSPSPNIRENRHTSATYRDQTSPPQLPPRSSRSSSTARTADSAYSPVFSPRHLSPSSTEVSSSASTTQGSILNSNYVTPSPGHPYYSRKSPSMSSSSTHYQYAQPGSRTSYDHQDPSGTATESDHQSGFHDAYKQESYDNYNQPGGYSSLPRHFSNSVAQSLSRGSPAYSSARYEAEHKRKARSLNRNGSFHTHSESSTQLVSPLTRSRAQPSDSVVTSSHQHQQHDASYDLHPRKYSLPVMSQQSSSYSTPGGKSHSGSQLPGIRSSPYPPLREDLGDARSSNHSTNHGDFESNISEYGFPTFYSQWGQEPQEHQHHIESSSHQYQSISPSFSESRSRHPSLPPEHDALRDQSLHEISDLQNSFEDLLLQERHSVERTHRRSHSCDASKAKREGIAPSPYDEVKSRHHSLIRRPHHTMYEEVKREILVGKETGDAVRESVV